MTKTRTVGQYRAIDLGCFAVMLVVFEPLLHYAATRLFPAEPYMVSVTAAITAIVLMRWGVYGGIHALLGGLVFCFVSGASPAQYLIYGAGNLLSLLALFLLKAWGREEVRKDPLRTIAFALTVQLLMQAGQAIVALILGNGRSIALGFFTTGVISDLFTAVVLWIARRLDGIFEDQIHYLLRIQKETEKKGTY